MSLGNDEMDFNPFRDILREKLGPQISYGGRQSKQLQNLHMIDGFAHCRNVNYQRTYLDRINIKRNYIQENFNDKPVHIDKLFENEDLFLENSN